MTEQTTTPAELDAEMDKVIADAKLAESAVIDQDQSGVDATDIAFTYASDYGIDIREVKGTGKDGRVTVPDVEKFKKALDAKAVEDPVTEDAQPVEEGEAEPEPKPKPKKKRAKGKGIQVLPALPNIFVGMTEIYHVVRFINEYGMGDWNQLVVSGPEADENLGDMLEEGFQLIHAQPLGWDENGIGMLWVFGKFAKKKVERFPYEEIRHITQRIGGLGEDGRGVTGQYANEMISGYLQAGYDLAMVEALDKGVDGVVNVMWILVR